MAYKHYVRQALITGRYGLMDQIDMALESMGWTLCDGISMANRKVANYNNVTAGSASSPGTITIPNHGFSTNDSVFYITTGSPIGGLTANTLYYVIKVDDNTFQLASSSGGSAINLTSYGSNNHIFIRGGAASCTYDSTSHTFTSASPHGFANGDYVFFVYSGGVPSGMTLNQGYYVFGVSGNNSNTFKLADAPNSSTSTYASNNGTGPHVFTNGNWRVYKSAGELSDRWPEYILVFVQQSTNNVYFMAYENWDTTYHYGTAASYNGGYGLTSPETYIATTEGSLYYWIYGSLDTVFIYTLISGTYAQAGFGHLNKRYWPTPVSTTTGAISSGSNVTVSVADASNFIVGKKYQIIGRYTSGGLQTGRRETATLSAVNTASSPNTLTFSSVANNYDSGAFIGKTPSTFGLMPPNGDRFYATCFWDASGSATAPSGVERLSTFVPENGATTNPETRTGSFVLQPLAFYTYNGSDDGLLGYIDQYMYHCYSSNFAREDMMALNVLSSGTCTSATTNTLSDSGKASIWTNNAFATNVVMITSGPGAGEIHKILSNDTTSITITDTWVTVPTNASTYLIVDEAYRYLYGSSAGSNYLDAWLREGIM
jgi:hypothetical protein